MTVVTEKKKGYFPLGNLLPGSKFIQNSRIFLVRGEECICLSWGDYGCTNLSRIEITREVWEILKDEYVFEETDFGTFILNLKEEDEILIVSESKWHYMSMRNMGNMFVGNKAWTADIRAHACGTWGKVEMGFTPL